MRAATATLEQPISRVIGRLCHEARLVRAPIRESAFWLIKSVIDAKASEREKGMQHGVVLTNPFVRKVGYAETGQMLAPLLTRYVARVIPFIPLRTAERIGYEESVVYVALYQRLERISPLFTFDA